MMSALKSFIVLSCISICHGFAPMHLASTPARTMPVSMLSSNNNNNDESIIANTQNERSIMDRRKLFTDAAIKTASTVGILSTFPSFALAERDEESAATPVVEVKPESKPIGTDSEKPIAIIGAGGKVGNLCTNILNKQGLYTRAITRSGRQTLSERSDFVSYASGDVTNYEAIKKAVEGSSGVIFAASASGKKKGGDPEHVDYLGLYNTAKACLECGVPKLVVISAGSVTRPDFVGFKATNLFVKYVYGDKIMDHKIAGEAVMRDLYANQSDCAYCVVRPGGLSDSQAEGPGLIHVSQGDVYSAEITRQDVAEVTVAALLKGKTTDFTTFELNNQKGLAKVSKDLETPPDELVHEGAKSYDTLLDGLLTDSEMISKYPQYISGFRGDNIKPISNVL